jgi:hypothetical protein
MRRAFALFMILLTGCTFTTVPCEVGNFANSYIRPARAAKRVCTEHQAGTTHVAVLSVAPWEDYVAALQPVFDITAKDALEHAVPTTSSLDASLLSALAISARVAGPTLDSDGKKTPGKVDDSVKPPESGIPANGSASTNLPQSQQAITPDVDPMLRHRAAAALYEEVQLMNRYLRDAAVGTGNVQPYVVRVQVTLMPHARKEPYDAYATISFFNGRGATANAPAAPFALRTNEWNREASKQYNSLPRVLPLLVNDDIESTRFSDATERIRTIAAAVVAMSGNAQVSGGITSRVDDLKKALSNDFNSLLTVTRESENTVRARLGAARNGLSYAMVPQTHNITFLVITAQGTDAISYVSRTTFRDAELGSRLPATPPWKRRHDANELTEQWIKQWNVEHADIDAIHRAFTFADAGDYPSFTKQVQAFLNTNDQNLVNAARDQIWTDMQDFYGASTFSKGSFDLPHPDVKWFRHYATLLDDDVSATLQVMGGNNIDGARLRALVTAKAGKNIVTVPARSVHVSADRADATIVFPSLRQLLGAAPEQTNVELYYAASPYAWVSSPQSVSTPVSFLAVNTHKPASVVASTSTLAGASGTGTVQLLVKRDADFDGKIYFAVKGGDVTGVTPSVGIENGDRVFPDTGAFDVSLRNLVAKSSVVITAWAMKDGVRIPLDNVSVQIAGP